MKISDDNFITIQGWMITRLKLSGPCLMIYAIIYGFSQDGESTFHGSRQYLSEWCGCSLSTTARSLKSLMDSGLIEQVHHSIDNTEVYYRAVSDPSVKLTRGASVKMTQGSCQNDTRVVSKCDDPSVKMTRAIKDDNIEDKQDHNIVDIVVCDTKRTRFCPPTLEEVKEYSERNGSAVVDPVRFFDYYESNGWKVGKNQMKDWKAAFRNWERTEKVEKTGGSVDKVAYMQNEYTKEYLEQKEKDDLDSLIAELDE